MQYYISARETLENIIEKTISSKKTKNYLKILGEQKPIPKELIVEYVKDFYEELKKEISEEEYYAICGGTKDNRKPVYNPLILITKLERKIIKIDEKPNFSNFTNSLDKVVNKLNSDKRYVKYPYSIVLIFNGNGTSEAYEISIIRIPEAYFLLAYNKDFPVRKEPPIKNNKFINEFEIEINSKPKKDFTKVYVEGYQNLGTFRIYSDSEFDRMQRMRKIKYKGEIYYTNVLGRAPLQTLYTLNLLENKYNGEAFEVIVSDPSLLRIISGIYRSIITFDTKVEIPAIFTYLMIQAKLRERREEGLNSFYITNRITKEKLDNLHNMLYPSIKYIGEIMRIKKLMTRSAVF